jgi:membrane protein DedA with SNARE-associated domain
MFEKLTAFILASISSTGYFGILILMTIESSFIPFPSEIVLIPAGYLIYEGKLNFWLVLIASILGSLFGALINYYLAKTLGRKVAHTLITKYGKWFLLSTKSLDNSGEYFKKHGSFTTLIGRLIPVVRQLISLPAGFAKMPILKFSIFTMIGAALWSLVLIGLGYTLGQNQELIKTYLTQITIFTLVVCVIAILVYIKINKRKK